MKALNWRSLPTPFFHPRKLLPIVPLQAFAARTQDSGRVHKKINVVDGHVRDIALSIKYLGVGLMVVVLISGCVVGPNYVSPSAAQLKLPPKLPGWVSADNNQDISSWWQIFQDPLLSSLIDRGTKENLTLAQASERIVQAHEAVLQARGAFYPSVGLDTSTGRNFNSMFPDSSSYSSQGSVSWVIDLFGALKRAKEASRYDLQAFEYDYEAIRVSIASQIAESYIGFRADQLRLEIATESLGFQDQNLDIARWRSMAGLVSDLDVQQARVQREQTAASIPLLQLSLTQARDRIALLIGEPPGAVDALLAKSAPIPSSDNPISIGLPADLLRQRPDVRVSERRVAAATARIGVAKAQLYPQLALNGNLGTSAASLGSLGDLVTGGVFSGLTQTLFQGGQLRSRYRGQQAVAREAMLAYRATILTALRDVADGMAALQSAERRRIALTQAEAAATAAAKLARRLYRAGLTQFQNVLVAEQALISSRNDLVSVRSAHSVALVRLYEALGGGWQPRGPIQSTGALAKEMGDK